MAGITLLQKLQKLYGARAVSDRLGRTTNVQTLAQGQNNPFRNTFSQKYLTKNPDGVEEAHNVIMENMQFAFGNKNAQQMKNFEANVDTLFEIKFPPAKAEAEILDLSTKKQVTGEGIDSLKNKMGLPEGVSPNSPMGKILTSQNRLKKMSQELEELGAKTYSAPEEGRRRAVMRQILLRDKRLNLPENIRDSLDNFKDLQRGGDKSMDPLALFMKYYKRDNDKLDKLDDISRESKDAIDAADNFLVKDDTIELLDDDLGTKLKDYDGDPDEMAQGGIAGQLHLNKGGRVGLKKGGPPNPSRRNFMKLVAGLASIPVFGKFFKFAKPAAKIATLKNTTTTMPTWFPDFVDKFVAKGIAKKIDEDIIEYTTKELPNIKMTKHDDGRVFVGGDNDYGRMYEVEYEPPGYEVLDYETGKAVRTKGDFRASEDVPTNMDPYGNTDFDGETLESMEDILSSDVRVMEEFTKGKKFKYKEKNYAGESKVGQAEVAAENRADAFREQEAMDAIDGEDFATGGRVGMLVGGGVLKTIIQNLAKERGVTPTYLLEMTNFKTLPKRIRDKMSPKEIEGFVNNRIEQVENIKEMIESRLRFNQSIQQGKSLDDQGTGMSDIFDFMEKNFTKDSPIPKDVSKTDVLQMEQMIKNMKTKGRKLNAKGGLAGQLL